MSLKQRFVLPSLIVVLALTGALGVTWITAPAAEAQAAGPQLPCGPLNEGATVILSSGTCHHDVPAWTTYTCTERNGRYFWLASDLQCGDVISPALTP